MMKILMVNKFLCPRGGAETYVFKLGKILEEHGHELQYFGMEDENNIVGNRVGSYVTKIDFQQGIRKNLTAPLRIIYSVQSRRKIRAVLEDFHPDVVHLNNIQFQLTPSMILEIHRFDPNIKIIYTVHDYQLLCPNHGMIDNQLKPCEKCMDGNYFHCLKGKCIKRSYLKSLLGLVDAYFWKFNRAYDYVDTYIAPSEFLKKKLDSQKRFAGKTVTIHNFVNAVEEKDVEKEDYILQFGRLTRDKGTETVLKAAKQLPQLRFVFAGAGEMEEEIKAVDNAEYVGFKQGEELEQLVRKAKLSLCLSELYENCPFSVIESQMLGTPVIGSKMGGIPELIQTGVSGELIEAGNTEELVSCIRRLWNDPLLLQQYSENCKKAEIETAETYYEKLMKIYQ